MEPFKFMFYFALIWFVGGFGIAMIIDGCSGSESSNKEKHGEQIRYHQDWMDNQ